MSAPKLKRGREWRKAAADKYWAEERKKFEAESWRNLKRFDCNSAHEVTRMFARLNFSDEELAGIDAKHAATVARMQPVLAHRKGFWASVFG